MAPRRPAELRPAFKPPRQSARLREVVTGAAAATAPASLPQTVITMAPRRPAELRPAVKPAPRRSARLQEVLTAAPAAPLAPINQGNRISKPPPKKSRKLDCLSCGRTLSTASFSKHLATDTCEHSSMSTCKLCLKAWIKASLDNNTHDKLSCPECPELMQNSNVKEHAAQDVYAKFDELERHAFADKSPGWRWCMNAGCRAGQIHEPLLREPAASSGSRKTRKGKKSTTTASEDDICVCDECGAKACVPCDRPYHDGQTCVEYQRRISKKAKEEQASVRAIEKQCKKCPGPRCGKDIQKNGGCDHMRCSQCGTHFCWRCLVNYNVVNRDGHFKGCIYAQPGHIDPNAPNAPNPNGNLNIGGLWNMGFGMIPHGFAHFFPGGQ